MSAPSPAEDTTTLCIDRGDVDAVMFGGHHPAYGLATRNGEPVGILLGDVVAGSAVARLGARSGDVIEAVNGIELTSWAAATKVESSAREGRSFLVRVQRDGRPVTLSLALSQTMGNST